MNNDNNMGGDQSSVVTPAPMDPVSTPDPVTMPAQAPMQSPMPEPTMAAEDSTTMAMPTSPVKEMPEMTMPDTTSVQTPQTPMSQPGQPMGMADTTMSSGNVMPETPVEPEVPAASSADTPVTGTGM